MNTFLEVKDAQEDPGINAKEFFTSEHPSHAWLLQGHPSQTSNNLFLHYITT
jgi:hypothetical protein